MWLQPCLSTSASPTLSSRCPWIPHKHSLLGNTGSQERTYMGHTSPQALRVWKQLYVWMCISVFVHFVRTVSYSVFAYLNSPSSRYVHVKEKQVKAKLVFMMLHVWWRWRRRTRSMFGGTTVYIQYILSKKQGIKDGNEEDELTRCKNWHDKISRAPQIKIEGLMFWWKSIVYYSKSPLSSDFTQDYPYPWTVTLACSPQWGPGL